MENKVTILFTILDDLSHSDYILPDDDIRSSDCKWQKFPIVRQIRFNENEIRKFVEEMKLIYNKNLACSNFNWTGESTDRFIVDLISNRFSVVNRVEKYYVVAFSIDGTRFEIYSKDCEKKLIEWDDTVPVGDISEQGFIDMKKEEEASVQAILASVMNFYVTK